MRSPSPCRPRPDVITASLGYGTDAYGMPGRYPEDDPVQQSVIAPIVRQYGITVVVSSNDGTRLYTNAAVGPDGGSTPTDVTRKPADTTRIDDDQMSTTPTRVLDSGAITAGGTTTDDTLSVPPQDGGAASTNGRLGSHHERAVQLDPATRTGCTYAGDGSQIQQFSY